MLHEEINPSLSAIQFINTAQKSGELTGRLSVTLSRERSDLSSYALHWGNAGKQKLPANSLLAEYGLDTPGWGTATRYVATRPLMFEFKATPIPTDAEYFLVLAKNQDGEERLYASRPLVNREHLLPPNATPLERSLAATAGRLSQLPVQIDRLWDVNSCPNEFLPWLGWATSVDTWFDNKNDPAEQARKRRSLIRNSMYVHQHKGTRAALVKALETFTQASIRMTEWWQQTPKGTPHTFQLELSVNANAAGVVSAELDRQLRSAIDAVKPVRSHYTLTISTVQNAQLRAGALSQAVSYKRFNMAAALPPASGPTTDESA